MSLMAPRRRSRWSQNRAGLRLPTTKLNRRKDISNKRRESLCQSGIVRSLIQMRIKTKLKITTQIIMLHQIVERRIRHWSLLHLLVPSRKSVVTRLLRRPHKRRETVLPDVGSKSGRWPTTTQRKLTTNIGAQPQPSKRSSLIRNYSTWIMETLGNTTKTKLQSNAENGMMPPLCQSSSLRSRPFKMKKILKMLKFIKCMKS